MFRVLILDDSKNVIFKNETDLGFSINDDSYFKKNKDEAVNIFSDKLNSLSYPEAANSENSVNVLIDTSLTFLNVLPVDFSEDKKSIYAHILWELSNYFPDTYKDYIINYYRLHNNYLSENIDEILLIAVDKNKIEAIKNLCNGNGIRIRNIDIDQLAAEKCLKENYATEFENRNILLIGCKNNRLDYSFFLNGKLKYYDFQITSKTNISSFLLKQTEFFNLMPGNAGIEKVFLYGGDKSVSVRDFFSKAFSKTPVSFIQADAAANSKETQSIFAPLYGLGLKNFS